MEHFIADAKAQLKCAQSDITGEIYQLFYGMLNTMEFIACALEPPNNESLELFKKIFKMNFKWFIKPTCGHQKRKPAANAVVAMTPPIRAKECDNGPNARPSAEESSRPNTNAMRRKVVRHVSSLSLSSVMDLQDLEPVLVEERPQNGDRNPSCSERRSEANHALAAHPLIRDWNSSCEPLNAATFHKTTSTWFPRSDHPIKVEGGVGGVREPTCRKKRKEYEPVATQQGTSENDTNSCSRHTNTNTTQRHDIGFDDVSISSFGIMMDDMCSYLPDDDDGDISTIQYDAHVENEIDSVCTLDQIIKYADQSQYAFG